MFCVFYPFSLSYFIINLLCAGAVLSVSYLLNEYWLIDWLINWLIDWLFVFQVSVIVDKKALMLHILFEVEHTVMLTFREEYGHIVTHQWSVHFYSASA